MSTDDHMVPFVPLNGLRVLDCEAFVVLIAGKRCSSPTVPLMWRNFAEDLAAFIEPLLMDP